MSQRIAIVGGGIAGLTAAHYLARDHEVRLFEVAPRALEARDEPIAAIWSTEPESMLEFPARTLVAFLDNHGMLSIDERPQWRVVRGGSRSYVDEIAARLGDRLRLAAPVASVRRHDREVEITTRDGVRERFDHVVARALGAKVELAERKGEERE